MVQDLVPFAPGFICCGLSDLAGVLPFEGMILLL